MKSIRARIEGVAWLFEITCFCGNQNLCSSIDGEKRNEHRVKLGDAAIALKCECGAEFQLKPQKDYVDCDLTTPGVTRE